MLGGGTTKPHPPLSQTLKVERGGKCGKTPYIALFSFKINNFTHHKPCGGGGLTH